MQKLQLFLLLYGIVIALIYALVHKSGGVPPLLPGDIYRHIGTKKIYIPLGSSLIITLVLFIILLFLLPDKAPVSELNEF